MSVNLVNQTDASLAPIAGATLYADEPIGAILPFGGSTVPNGFLLCNGTAVSRTTYAALFAVIGTSFGVGDDSTTFNVPDLRESVPVGAGQNATQTIATHDTYTVGEFKDDQFQSHVHNTRLKGHMTTSSGDAWCTAYDQEVTGTRTTSASTDTGFTPREGTTTHGKQLGVNYIIKATTIALPSDFEDAVDEKIDDALNPMNFSSATPAAAGTPNSTYVLGSSYAFCYRLGGMVIAIIALTCSTVPPVGTSVFDGLIPNNAYPVNGALFNRTNNGFAQIDIGTDGRIYIRNAIVAGESYFGQLIYFTNEAL